MNKKNCQHCNKEVEKLKTMSTEDDDYQRGRGNFAHCYIVSTLTAENFTKPEPVKYEPKPRVKRRYKR